MKLFLVITLLLCLYVVPTSSTALSLHKDTDIQLASSEKTYKYHSHHYDPRHYRGKHHGRHDLKAFIEKTFAVIDSCDAKGLGKRLAPSFRTFKQDGSAVGKEQSLKEYEEAVCQPVEASGTPLKSVIKEYLQVAKNVVFVRVNNQNIEYAQTFHVVPVYGSYLIQNVMTTAVFGDAA